VDKKSFFALFWAFLAQYLRKKFLIKVAKKSLFRYLCTPKMKKGGQLEGLARSKG